MGDATGERQILKLLRSIDASLKALVAALPPPVTSPPRVKSIEIMFGPSQSQSESQ
jgi:hypothetical protein